MLHHSSRHRQKFIPLAGMQDKKKGRRRADLNDASKWRVAGFRAGLRAHSGRWYIRFRAAEAPQGIRAHAREDGDLRGPGLLGLAVLALALRADELSVHKDMVALVELVGDRLAEAIEGDAMPLDFRNLFASVFFHEHGVERAHDVASDVPYLVRIRVWAEEEIRLGNLPSKSGNILEAILYRGELPRGDAAGVVNTSDRQARRIVSALLDHGVLTSESPRSPVRLLFPAHLASRWMPGLFPDQT